jgi:hypothetical protein
MLQRRAERLAADAVLKPRGVAVSGGDDTIAVEHEDEVSDEGETAHAEATGSARRRAGRGEKSALLLRRVHSCVAGYFADPSIGVSPGERRRVATMNKQVYKRS